MFVFVCLFCIFFFFFSSRRRHTRCLSDWSSDVCSSDLAQEVNRRRVGILARFVNGNQRVRLALELREVDDALKLRSEERRVGKECRSRWWPYNEKKKKEKKKKYD